MFSRSFLAFLFCSSIAFALPVPVSNTIEILRSLQRKSYEIPIHTLGGVKEDIQRRGDLTGSAGLGDVSDLLYFVSVQLGNSTTSLVLDTGSSDLWVMSDECKTETCASSTSTPYNSESARLTGADVNMGYGDSKTGTHAIGPIVLDTVSVAGLSMDDQPFAAVNDTNNSAVENGGAGLFGLGFPSQSVVQAAVVNKRFDTPQTTDAFVADTPTDGPLLARMAMSGQLEQPMFAITLQRDTIDVGGNEGALTVGRLPEGVDNSSIIWVPVRLYATEDGGQNAPTFAPNEVYPLRWEVPLDAVYLDGQKLPDTNLTGEGIKSKSLSALIDSGNSLLRGPQDVVNSIFKTISTQFAADSSAAPLYPCATPHTLAYQIGGKMFPVDPRDFATSDHPGDATNCSAQNLVSTDAPSSGALYSWNIGAPFFRSNLVVFYFGNLTHPSVDPPRIGFLNTVPSNADELLKQAVQRAQANQGRFPTKSDVASPATITQHVPATTMSIPPPAPTQGNVRLAPESTAGANKANGASAGRAIPFTGVWFLVLVSMLALHSVV